MLLLIDNYDSFTYNLVQYIGDLGWEAVVHRNDRITVDEAMDLSPQAIMLSPGPCDPDRAGICLDMVGAAAERGIPLMGVCLGHQTIGQFFGGKVVRGPSPMHGKISQITHDGKGLMHGLPSPISVTRYHSLVVARDSLPDCLEITAESTDDGIIMSLSHKDLPIHGVQFHPESIACEHGHDMIRNFLDSSRRDVAA